MLFFCLVSLCYQNNHTSPFVPGAYNSTALQEQLLSSIPTAATTHAVSPTPVRTVPYLHIPCLVPQQDKEPKEQSSIHLLVSHSFQQLDNVYTVCSLALQYIRAVQNGCYDTQGALPQVYWCLRIP